MITFSAFLRQRLNAFMKDLGFEEEEFVLRNYARKKPFPYAAEAETIYGQKLAIFYTLAGTLFALEDEANGLGFLVKLPEVVDLNQLNTPKLKKALETAVANTNFSLLTRHCEQHALAA